MDAEISVAEKTLRLEIENSRLKLEVEVLRGMPHQPAISDPEIFAYGLSPLETKLFSILKHAGPRGLAKERLMALCYASSLKDWPDYKTLDVRICSIRKKLLTANAPDWIQTIPGLGWVFRSDAHTALSHLTVKHDRRLWCKIGVAA